jgi:Apoptosis-antagonizing transcription factor, C-terminal/Apoptosis antagonizing transcription factor
MSTKKRNGVFDAVDTLESQDINANKKKKRVLENDQRKSKAAQSQVKVFENLMELRILLQRVIHGVDEEGDNNVGCENERGEETQEMCNQLLLKLLHARNILTGLPDQEYGADDCDFDTAISANYEATKDEWKEVFNKRYKDLRLHSGLTAKAQFKLLDSDFWQQVESTSTYELALVAGDHFDDSKVYQHMLQDFLLGRGKNTAVDAIKRKKGKNSAKDVDRRASKGRKIRYAVIPKLVNFTFPQQRGETAMDDDEWFKSLFGGGEQRK